MGLPPTTHALQISCYVAVCCKRRAKPEKLMPEWEEMAAVSCAVQVGAREAQSGHEKSPYAGP